MFLISNECYNIFLLFVQEMDIRIILVREQRACKQPPLKYM